MKKKNYYTENNICISAGGLLFYDDQGIWVIKEQTPFGVFFNDPGGKYQFEDTNINICIIREFHEETYFSYTNLIHNNLLDELISKNLIHEIFISTKSEWWYKCILIHTKYIFPEMKNCLFDNKKFFINRLNTIEHNKLYNFYNSIEFLYLKNNTIKNKWDMLSERLKTIIINSRHLIMF